MNTEEFLKALKRLRGWNIFTEGCIRLNPTGEDNGIKFFCPITAVCYDVKKDTYIPASYSLAAAKLGMSSKLADRIVRASDGDPIHFFMRHRLKRALA